MRSLMLFWVSATGTFREEAHGRSARPSALSPRWRTVPRTGCNIQGKEHPLWVLSSLFETHHPVVELPSGRSAPRQRLSD